MSKDQSQGGPNPGADKRAGRTDERIGRQAEALRANLRRRKAQAQERGEKRPKPIKNPDRKP